MANACGEGSVFVVEFVASKVSLPSYGGNFSPRGGFTFNGGDLIGREERL